ncbi:MAG: hypothetical protein PHN56_03290 [Candidatus Nanoarchaeia archaeon]|nr:hypothetical protein [Candidatus Nanoarchaeia archaeon]
MDTEDLAYVLNNNMPRKKSDMSSEERFGIIKDDVNTIMDYLTLQIPAYIEKSINSLQSQINNLNNKLYSLETKTGTLENTVNKLAEEQKAAPKSLRREIMDLGKDVFNPNRKDVLITPDYVSSNQTLPVQAKVSMPPPPPPAPKIIEKPKPSVIPFDDVRNELKEKLRILKNKADEED